jgi:hypothetical protein
MRRFFTICLLVTGLHSSLDAHADHITELLRTLAEQGGAEAQYHLGVKYANGEGVVQDYKQAMVWYRKATPTSIWASCTTTRLFYFTNEFRTNHCAFHSEIRGAYSALSLGFCQSQYVYCPGPQAGRSCSSISPRKRFSDGV